MLSVGDSHARTFHALEKERELMANVAECGEKWRELLVKYDRNTHSWKTHLCLWEEDLQESSVTLPRWGMMQDGVCWERSTQEHVTNEREFGYLPTIVCQDSRHAISRHKKEDQHWKSNLGEVIASVYEDHCANGLRLNPEFAEWFMGWTLGWTDLKPLEMDKFHNVQHSHGEF
jgi:hypothetical protein